MNSLTVRKYDDLIKENKLIEKVCGALGEKPTQREIGGWLHEFYGCSNKLLNERIRRGISVKRQKEMKMLCEKMKKMLKKYKATKQTIFTRNCLQPMPFIKPIGFSG